MNKKYIFIIFLSVITLSYIFNIDKLLSKKISILDNTIKINYKTVYSNIENSITKYFNQAQQIEDLRKINKRDEKIQLLQQISSNYNINKKLISLYKIDVLSYKNFNDFSNIILINNHFLIPNTISALITNNGYSAGIAREQNNQYLGLLNHNPKCNYSVFIGKNNIPGITRGDKNQKNITIEYIPIWKKINIGDEVVTSGMDNIFPANIQVGKIVEITKLSTTQKAKVKPYAKVYNKKYFYLYTSYRKDTNI
jgi:rod shape-determining protein MreC